MSGSDGERLHKLRQQAPRTGLPKHVRAHHVMTPFLHTNTQLQDLGLAQLHFLPRTGSVLAILLSPLGDGHCVSLKVGNTFPYLYKGSQVKSCHKSQKKTF